MNSRARSRRAWCTGPGCRPRCTLPARRRSCSTWPLSREKRRRSSSSSSSTPSAIATSARLDELVPHPVDGHDEARLAPAVADLRPQLRDVRVHGAGRGVALVAPDVLEELVTGDRLPLPLDQVAQQLELARRHVQLLGAARGAVGPVSYTH